MLRGITSTTMYLKARHLGITIMGGGAQHQVGNVLVELQWDAVCV